MNTLSWSIIISGGVISLFVIGFGIFTIWAAKESIFHGSGAPISMSKMLLSSVHITSQHLLGILIIVILSLLIANQILETNAGLPVLSAIAGYLLGKTFKDVTFTPSKKSSTEDS